MIPARASAFSLPPRLAAKAAPALIGADEAHFTAIAQTLARQVAELARRLEEERRRPVGEGQDAADRDLAVRRLSGRLRLLQRFGLDLCLGRIAFADGSEPAYIGRLGLTDDAGRRLLIDWRAPAAAPFFAATRARAMGLAGRRRYRWVGGHVSDYWDESFGADGASASLDDESAFIASLGASRSPRMRDVLGTIQADQDAVIRSASRGALVVDGGPGTGKTVVALHRAAYLLYADPHLAPGSGGTLVVGPSEAYLAYVDDVLPSLGEDSVQLCTLRDLVAEGRTAPSEADLRVAALKGDARWSAAIERAVRLYERPPDAPVVASTPWADVRLTAVDWDEAFAAVEPGTPHNEARDQVWDTLVEIVIDRHDEDIPPAMIRRAAAHDGDLVRTFARAWPLIDPAGLVAALWSDPSFLRRVAPWLTDDEVDALQRRDSRAWTRSDLPLLDGARLGVGDPDASRRRRVREAELAAQRAEMDAVVEHMIAADDSEMMLMSILKGQDAQNSLVDQTGLTARERDPLSGPFAHLVVDEAQELTDAEWHMLLRRCPSRSLTIVGDRAQARHGFTESWQERLARIGLHDVRVASLTINYRTPEEVMIAAEPVIRAEIPDANVPMSIRSTGVPVRHGSVSELEAILDTWLEEHAEGIACVIGDPTFAERARVRALTPEAAKGLEFDLVILVDPDALGGGIAGAVDRYVAMTRATERLVVLSGQPA